MQQTLTFQDYYIHLKFDGMSKLFIFLLLVTNTVS